jgi:5-methylcytosine-specific restriction protein A
MLNIFRKELRYAIRSSRWKTVRKEFLKKNNTCAACGKNKDIEVHHIEPVHLAPELELEPSNLISLCANSCHLLFGHFMDFKSWNPNVENDCQIILDKIKNRPYK